MAYTGWVLSSSPRRELSLYMHVFGKSINLNWKSTGMASNKSHAVSQLFTISKLTTRISQLDACRCTAIRSKKVPAHHNLVRDLLPLTHSNPSRSALNYLDSLILDRWNYHWQSPPTHQSLSLHPLKPPSQTATTERVGMC